MAEYVDLKYIGLISSRLERYKVRNHSPLKANFRCPYCSDSRKSKTKTRGWLLEKSDGKLIYYCHNCFKSVIFTTFLSDMDTTLYNEYIVEKFINGKSETNMKFGNEKPKGVVSKSSGMTRILSIDDEEIEFDDREEEDDIDELDYRLAEIKCIDDMPFEHPAVQYVVERKIPRNKFDSLFYVPKFKKWTNKLLPNKFDNKSLERDEPRLIIPFVDKNGVLFGYTGRSFDPKTDLRYVTIMLDETKTKFYGLNKVDMTKQYYVLEGTLDSLFIDNAMAMSGADARIETLPNKENAVIVFDNEPRNPDIHARMEDAMSMGFKVLFWPSSIHNKDVNNMILNEDLTTSDINGIVSDKSNQYTGMEGQVKLAQWKRVMSRDDFNKKRQSDDSSPNSLALTVRDNVRFVW